MEGCGDAACLNAGRFSINYSVVSCNGSRFWEGSARENDHFLSSFSSSSSSYGPAMINLFSIERGITPKQPSLSPILDLRLNLARRLLDAENDMWEERVTA